MVISQYHSFCVDRLPIPRAIAGCRGLAPAFSSHPGSRRTIYLLEVFALASYRALYKRGDGNETVGIGKKLYGKSRVASGIDEDLTCRDLLGSPRG